MGHRNLNLAVLIAGFFTLGAVFAGSNQADAHVITCAETVIESSPPKDACTEFSFQADDSVRCLDDGETYDSEHYAILKDEDYDDTFYLAVWR